MLLPLLCSKIKHFKLSISGENMDIQNVRIIKKDYFSYNIISPEFLYLEHKADNALDYYENLLTGVNMERGFGYSGCFK